MTRKAPELSDAVRSLYEIRGALLGLSGLFTNAGDNGMSQFELEGVGSLLSILSERLAANAEVIELNNRD